MRCQRVRYYLSAFCRGELSEGKRKAVAAHLQSCTECSREESFIREMSMAGRHLRTYQTAPDFNARLLNRIAEERFKETRSKAYFPPKKAPVFSWSRAIPVAATACLVLAFVLTGGVKNLLTDEPSPLAVEEISTGSGLDDRYLTVQPQGEHALAIHKRTSAGSGQWAFQKELARVNRIKGFVNSLASQNSFDPYAGRGGEHMIMPVNPRVYLEIILNGQPLTRPLPNNQSTNTLEAGQTY